MLTDVLSLVSPTAFGRASRVRSLTRQMSEALREPACWKNEIAAMLSQIGCVAIPDKTLARLYRGEALSRSEAAQFAVHPLVGRDLLKNIPRLEDVAEIIAYQEKHFDGEGPPPDDRRGHAIPLGSRILKVALDFDTFVSNGNTHDMAVSELAHRTGWYDPDVLAALCGVLNVTKVYAIHQVKVHELADGMILAADVRSKQGTLICAKGHEVNRATRLRLKNYDCNVGICEPIQIFLQPDDSGENGEPTGEPPERMASDMLSFALED